MSDSESFSDTDSFSKSCVKTRSMTKHQNEPQNSFERMGHPGVFEDSESSSSESSSSDSSSSDSNNRSLNIKHNSLAESDDNIPELDFNLVIRFLESAEDQSESRALNNENDLDRFFNKFIKQMAADVVVINPNIDKNRAIESARQLLAPKKRKIKDLLGITNQAQDSAWEAGVSETVLTELKQLKQKILDQIEDERPTIAKILQAEVSYIAKKQAIEQFKILQHCEPDTLMYNSIKKTINNLILPKSFGSMTVAEIDAEEDRLSKLVPDHNKDMRLKIFNLTASDSDKSVMLNMLNKMESYLPGSQNRENIKKKLTFMVDLPFQKRKDSQFQLCTSDGSINRSELLQHLSQVRQRLDEKLHGMSQIKDKIIQIRNNQITCPGSKSILAFKGSAGLGKTSLAAAIAYAFDLPFEKISVGGMSDSSILKGTQEHWSGSNAQVMLHILHKTKVNNPVVLIDEVEKVEGTSKGVSVQYALFEMLDFEQNNKTKDLFIDELDHDLSNVFYIISMNDDKNLHAALKSRLEIIELPDYTNSEVETIVEKYLLPRSLKDIGLPPDSVEITSTAAREIVKQLGKSNGHYDIRLYRNEIFKIVSKLNYLETVRSGSAKRSLDDLEIERLRFNGFPFTITENTISIKTKKKAHLSYYT